MRGLLCSGVSRTFNFETALWGFCEFRLGLYYGADLQSSSGLSLKKFVVLQAEVFKFFVPVVGVAEVPCIKVAVVGDGFFFGRCPG